MFTIYEALNPKSGLDRIYIPRKEGEKGLISIQDCGELAIRGLEMYVHGSGEKLIQAARGDKIYRWFINSNCFEEIKERERIRRLGEESST